MSSVAYVCKLYFWPVNEVNDTKQIIHNRDFAVNSDIIFAKNTDSDMDEQQLGEQPLSQQQPAAPYCL